MDVALLIVFMLWILGTWALTFVTAWLRKDWEHAFKVAATILLLFPGVLLLPLALVVYGLFDVISRPRLDGSTKAIWSMAMILTLSLAVLPYLIWVLRRCGRSDIPDPGKDRLSSGETSTSDLTQEDLVYLHTLADLHDQGVISDEQFEEQRRRRLNG